MRHSKNGIGSVGWGLAAGFRAVAVLALAALVAPPALRADDQGQSLGAARLSSVDGDVQLSQGSQVLADQAVANTPLFVGTRVTTADNGRAEIQLEDGSIARLSPNSSLTLTLLPGQGGAGDAEIVLESGLGYFELQGGEQYGTIRVRFADSVVTAGGFTVVRINLDSPPGELAVFSGNAHLERGRAVMLDLHGGESVALSGEDATRYDLMESIEPDSWDSWNSDRDQVLTSEAASRTAATQSLPDSSNPAWNDLDANGNWYNVPGQGNIWSPYEASDPGWDPYGNGNWMWGGQAGYFWVSGYPWGYLPYQCGNWNYYDNFGWGWSPGLGGCSPWWGGGYRGPNIGRGFGGYRPPLPPPHPRGNPPGRGRGGFGPYPMIAVGRRPNGGNGATQVPGHDRGGSALIGGHNVQAYQPLAPRPQFEREAPGAGNRTGGWTVHSTNPGSGREPGQGFTQGSNSGSNPTSNPGSNPSSNPGSNAGWPRGGNPAPNQGWNRGQGPAPNQGYSPGSNRGSNPNVNQGSRTLYTPGAPVPPSNVGNRQGYSGNPPDARGQGNNGGYQPPRQPSAGVPQNNAGQQPAPRPAPPPPPSPAPPSGGYSGGGRPAPSTGGGYSGGGYSGGGGAPRGGGGGGSAGGGSHR
jgi:hypothetical protein